MCQGHVRLDRLAIFVLDEADRMLDMGFIRDVKKIIAALPKIRQTLLISATMPADIAQLAHSILKDPVKVEVTPVSSTVELIDQRVLFVDAANKRALLANLLNDQQMARTLVFTRTKHGANRVAEHLDRNDIRAEAIHGNKSQSARQRALESFRAGRVRVLVATDIAARGIDIDGITHVINYELPNVPESYVHRIGRTARAGASGVALAFCDAGERALLRDIERLTKRPLSVVADHPFAAANAHPSAHATPSRHRGGHHARDHKLREHNAHEHNSHEHGRAKHRHDAVRPGVDGRGRSDERAPIRHRSERDNPERASFNRGRPAPRKPRSWAARKKA